MERAAGTMGEIALSEVAPVDVTDDVVRTRRLELVDHAGRVRAVVGALGDDGDDEVVGMELRDAHGRTRVSVLVASHGPVIVFDSEGNGVLSLGVTEGADAVAKGPFAFLSDADGTPVAGWSVDQSGRLRSVG